MGRITQQKVDGTNKRVKEDVEEIKEFLAKEFTDEQQRFNRAELLKVKIERHLEYLKDMLEKAEEQEEINIETDKYDETVDEAETKKDELQTIITNHNKEREIEREKERIQRT